MQARSQRRGGKGADVDEAGDDNTSTLLHKSLDKISYLRKYNM
jgi:hypothetical protein